MGWFCFRVAEVAGPTPASPHFSSFRFLFFSFNHLVNLNFNPFPLGPRWSHSTQGDQFIAPIISNSFSHRSEIPQIPPRKHSNDKTSQLVSPLVSHWRLKPRITLINLGKLTNDEIYHYSAKNQINRDTIGLFSCFQWVDGDVPPFIAVLKDYSSVYSNTESLEGILSTRVSSSCEWSASI